MSRISSMDRLDSLKYAMLPYIPIGNIVFDEVLLYIQVRWWLSNMSIWLQSIVMQNHSFPKCGGVLFIAYNWILAHMKKALTKFSLLFILEVLTFFHLLAFVWIIVVDIYVVWRIVDKTNEKDVWWQQYNGWQVLLIMMVQCMLEEGKQIDKLGSILMMCIRVTMGIVTSLVFIGCHCRCA